MPARGAEVAFELVAVGEGSFETVEEISQGVSLREENVGRRLSREASECQAVAARVCATSGARSALPVAEVEETHNKTHNTGVHEAEAPQRNSLQGLKLPSRDGGI